ncbi:MAG TPA: pyridine nucleotide-disulfide oxidoreductase, partial [Candidatus Accumulibacter sp.]|nr:pyridine nucleotide-disulfide oxidoreductase [Accumulibacter sp.]
MNTRRLLLLAALAGLILAYFVLDLGRFLSLDYFKSQQQAIEAWRAEQPLKAALAFFVAYVLVTGLSLPGAAVM